MKLFVALRLGRVSNLPTIWSNVLAGIVLAGVGAGVFVSLCLLVAFSSLYISGMFLNDAFDAEFDRSHRPERPIASGEANVSEVFVAGFVMLCIGLAIVIAIASTGERPAGAAIISAIGLACAIMLYDFWHKGNPLGPALMGLCRLLVYYASALAVGGILTWPVTWAGLVALCYLIGLTYIAKQETLGRVANLWPLGCLAVPFAYGIFAASSPASAAPFLAALLIWIGYALSFLRLPARAIGNAVGYLIAGISLLDAMFIAGQRQPALAGVAVLCFALTLASQSLVSGT